MWEWDASSLVTFDADCFARLMVSRIEIFAIISIVPLLTIWLLSLAPRLIISRILKRVVTAEGDEKHCWNELKHNERSTYTDRKVVIPSPDFVYSVVCADLSAPNEVFHFRSSFALEKGQNRLPKYASLGIYDNGGLCSEIISHPNSEIDLVIASVNNNSSDDDILAELENKCGPGPPLRLNSAGEIDLNFPQRRVVRMRTVTGVLLHRLLIEDPAEYPLFRELQSRIHCDKISLPALTSSKSKVQNQIQTTNDTETDINFRRRILMFVALVLTRPLLRMTPAQRGDTILSLLIVCSCSLVISAVLVLIFLKLLQRPYVVSQLQLSEAIYAGGWGFHSVTPLASDVSDATSVDTGNSAAAPTSASAAGLRRMGAVVDAVYSVTSWVRRVLHELVMFLHGALALLPSEVVYGVCMKDRDGQLLVYGGSYLIHPPDPVAHRPACLWWSVTIYGRDLFLIRHPEGANAYGVNSLQLQQAQTAQTGTEEESKAKNKSKEEDQKQCILCSPMTPAQYIEHLTKIRDDGAGTSELSATLAQLSPDMHWIALPAEDTPGAQLLASGPRLILRLYKPATDFLRTKDLAQYLPTVERVHN